MRFVVIGAGAIGGVVGGRLAEHGHDVVLVARGAHHAAIAADGLRIHSPTGTTTVRPALCGSVDEVGIGGDDVVLLAVKSHDTVEVLQELVRAAGSAVPIVCLQNGVNNEREALRRFDRVYGGVVMCPTVFLEPGHVTAHSAPTTGIVDVGRYPAGVDSITTAVVDALASSTFSAQTVDDIARWKWAKLVKNLGNAIEAVCGPPARKGRLNEVVQAEAVAVLGAAGIEYATGEEDRVRRADYLKVQPVKGRQRPGGSSWQSLARGRSEIETDYLNGEIVMLGRLYGIATPANEHLQQLARQLAETGQGPGAISDQELLASLADG